MGGKVVYKHLAHGARTTVPLSVMKKGDLRMLDRPLLIHTPLTSLWRLFSVYDSIFTTLSPIIVLQHPDVFYFVPPV